MAIFKLKSGDRKKLQTFIRSKPKGNENVRAITLLFRDGGQTRAETADALGSTPQTVTNTCQNYDNLGLGRALKDDPRPGGPVKFDDRIKSGIVAMLCSDPPEGFDRWTLELVKGKGYRKRDRGFRLQGKNPDNPQRTRPQALAAEDVGRAQTG